MSGGEGARRLVPGFVRLVDCPPGLFLYLSPDGMETLCFKTDYDANDGRLDCYIVESGEFFVGGVKDPWQRRLLPVLPVECAKFRARRDIEWSAVHE